ncbi:MAG: general secretion pathway protein GspB [Steroidobacteraceae bacterium]
MSFILDALKKSESDRQRQSGPSLFEVKVAPPRRRLPIWAVAIAVLLGINVIVISWMLLRHPRAQPAAANAPAAAPAVATPTAAASGGAVPLAIPGDRAPGPDIVSGRSPPESARPPRTASVTAAAGSATSGQTASAAPAASPPVATPSQTAAAASAGPADQSAAQHSGGGSPSDYAPAVEPAGTPGSGTAAGATGSLPLYQQIVTSDDLPALHLDLHVYAQRPQDRFVMINMHRLGEGDSLPNGVHVDAIRPDGVALSYHGIRFLLPRG